VKEAVDGYSFVRGANYQEVTRDMQKMAFAVGHNRAATLGSVTAENAHPFKVITEDAGKSLIGLHNGTVRGNLDYLPINLKDSGVTVDSHCIMKNLAHVDPDDAFTHVISKIEGAYMLVWHDERDGSLNFARNDTRVFHLAQSYTQDTLFFASESGTLQWLGDRNNLGTADVYFLEPGKALKFTKDTGLEPLVTDFTIAVPKPLPAKKPAVHTGKASGTPTITDGRGATTAGKQVARPITAPHGDNKLLLGGIRREVPILLRDALKEIRLAPEDRLMFTPVNVQKDAHLRKTSTHRYVVGFVDTIGMTAVIHRVHNHVAQTRLDSRWTVRPTGVKYTKPNKRDPILVCEFVASIKMPEILSLRGKQTSSPPSTTASKMEVQDGYKGPRGESIGASLWMHLTEGGCVSCERPINIAESEDCRWTVEKNPKVQCPDCAKLDDDAVAMLDAREHGIIH